MAEVVTATPTLSIGVSLQTAAPPTAVVQQTTPTPLPTATVTPSPTPIVYRVAEGDTLLAIALQQGVTVEEIVALNPGMDPDFLSIDQQVQLPPRPTAIAQPVSGTAVPLQITVSQVATYHTPVGGLWVLGLLRNDGEQAVENVQVQIELVDEAGGAAVQTVWAALPVLPVGESAPFGALFAQAPLMPLPPVASIISGQAVVDLGSRKLDLAVTETAVDLAADVITVSGSIHNEGVDTAVDIMLVATFFNGAGVITGFQLHRLAAVLPPAGTADFTFGGAPPGGQSTDVTLTIQAQKLDS